MAEPSAPPIVIAGAGVLGLSIAVELAARGRDVTVHDLRPIGPNASSVAAGLLSPIGEAVFDPEAGAHGAILAAAMALWPAFGERNGVEVICGLTRAPKEMFGALRRFDPTADCSAGYAWYSGDARVADPARALKTLGRRLLQLGGRMEVGAVLEAIPGAVTILAAGAGSRSLAGLAPELDGPIPVKGQIAILPRGPVDGPTLRWPGGYLAPQEGGARVGATMEAGLDDLIVDPDVIGRLIAKAALEAPGLDIRDAHGAAGVRMATPDGLPLVGPSRTPGVLIATGARRNGWLLAPLVANTIAAYVAGGEAGPWAAALHPARFGQV